MKRPMDMRTLSVLTVLTIVFVLFALPLVSERIDVSEPTDTTPPPKVQEPTTIPALSLEPKVPNQGDELGWVEFYRDDVMSDLRGAVRHISDMIVAVSNKDDPAESFCTNFAVRYFAKAGAEAEKLSDRLAYIEDDVPESFQELHAEIAAAAESAQSSTVWYVLAARTCQDGISPEAQEYLDYGNEALKAAGDHLERVDDLLDSWSVEDE